MKALILAGGKGTRFMEETDIKPKPMIEIDGKPLIIHIIDHYVKHGIKDFIILGGYKIDYFFKYFENQKLKDADEYFYLREDIKIKILDTGIETATGGRIKQAKKYLDEPFLMTYGDGLSNVNIAIVSVKGMVCDFCARGISKTFLKDKDVKRIDVDLDNGKVVIAFSKAKEITFSEIEKKILSNGQNMSDLQILEI